MLSVVVAEDEYIVRNSIVKFINENIDGVSVVASFADGSGVLEYLKEHKADVVLTDVKMFELSGLDVAKYICDNDIKTAVIIISAYRDFSYAKTAIDYKVCSYLLKPVMPDELRKALKKAEQFLAERYSADKDEEVLNVSDDENEQNEKKLGDRESVIMERALKFINENFHKDISLFDVASHVYLSEHYFGSIFKKNKAEGFTKYLNSVRLKEAERLLKTGRYSVKEISKKVGYNNCNYFIKLFKSQNKVTPKQYRFMLKDKNE